MTDGFPDHIQTIIDTVAADRQRHHASAGLFRRMEHQAIVYLARPGVQVVLAAGIVLWLGYNGLAAAEGWPVYDPPPFGHSANFAAFMSLLATLMILASQRHENTLSEQRTELTLQLALLSEQRSAKLIQMLDELRRDFPLVDHRPDAETVALAEPTDTTAMLDTVRANHPESTL